MPLPLMVAFMQASVEVSTWVYASYTSLGVIAGASSVYGGFKLQEYWQQKEIHNNPITNMTDSMLNRLQEIDIVIEDFLSATQKATITANQISNIEISVNLNQMISHFKRIQSSFRELKTLALDENELNQVIKDKTTYLINLLDANQLSLLNENQKIFSQNKKLLQQNLNKDKLIYTLFKIIDKHITNTEKTENQTNNII